MPEISTIYDLSNTTQVSGKPGYVKPMVPTVILPFNYADEDDVFAEVNGNPYTGGSLQGSVYTHELELEVSALPATLRVYRKTDISSLAQFSAGANLRSEDLNGNFAKLRMRLEEV